MLHTLLKRHPDAAKEKNDFGLLPLHVVAVSTDDVVAVEMVFNAHPDAVKVRPVGPPGYKSSSGIQARAHTRTHAYTHTHTHRHHHHHHHLRTQVPDRQGRTCLHLAVLAVGRDHEAAVSREEGHWCNDYSPGTGTEAGTGAADAGAGAGGGASRGGGQTNSKGGKEATSTSSSSAAAAKAKAKGDDDDSDSDDDEHEEAVATGNELLERDGSRSRRVIQFLIDKWPLALVTDNNFQATPVQTVLEKTKRVKIKSRKVMVFGLFDDPPSSRLLLTSHRFRAERRLLPPLRASHWEALR